jgi:RimJ/RimL family protein N-acetyltransferase
VGHAVSGAAIVPNTPSRESLPSVRLRPANAADCQRTWLWRNDPETRAASFESAEIPWDTHRRWFGDTLLREDRKLFVIEANGTPAGTTRLDIAGAEATVSIHLAREWRGCGVGTRALAALADLAFGELGIDRLLASVKPDNHASLAAFARAGFTRVESGAVVVLERRRDA